MKTRKEYLSKFKRKRKTRARLHNHRFKHMIVPLMLTI